MIEAAEWVERLDAGPGDAVRAQFEHWQAQPGHRAAFAAVVEAREASAALADHPDLFALRRAVAARGGCLCRSRRANGVAAAGG